MNVNESITTLLQIEARLDALKETRSRLRADLEAEARKQWEDQGAAPTYRVKGVGTASLSGADSWTPCVVDPIQWADWVRDNHGTEAEIVYRVPASAPMSALVEIDKAFEAVRSVIPNLQQSTEVRPLILKKLADACPILAYDDEVDGIVPLVTISGEIVPGVVMRRGSAHLAIRFDSERRRAVTAQEMHFLGVGIPDNPEFDVDIEDGYVST